MFQNPLIMYTLAHAHFVEYGNNLPVSSDLQLENLDKPCWRTYILSLQAVSKSHLIFSESDNFSRKVEHEFKSWKTGERGGRDGLHATSRLTIMVIAR